MSTSSIKRQIRRFHVVVVQWSLKTCTKKRDARAENVVVVVVVAKAPYYFTRQTSGILQ